MEMDRYEYTGQDTTEKFDVSYRLDVKYSNATADMLYTLVQYHERANGERLLSNTWTGNKSWAQRHSKHYGIEMPKEEK